MIVRSTRIVTPDGVRDGEVCVNGGCIAAVGARGETGPASEPVHDLGDRWLVPGYIDVHVHGGGGAQCNTADPADVMAMARFHAGHGTTAMLATTVSAPVAELEASCASIAACVRRGSNGAGGAGVGGGGGGAGGSDDSEGSEGDGAAVLGIHLEGPFISPRRPGAMDPGTFIDPSEEVFARLLSAGEGCVRMMTLAPERPDGLPLVEAAVAAGVIASIGHSDASYEQALAAVAAGARSATHTFNAMPALHHREPGVLGAVLDREEVDCELICDGVHVAPPMCRLVHRVKGPGAVHLVTDAMQAAGMPDGDYRLGGAAVTVSGGRAVIAGGGSIAGSTLTMDVAVANAVDFLGVSVPEAVALASARPAALLGIADAKGALAPGYDADMAVLDERLRACGTMVGGRWVVAPGGL